MSIAKQGRKHRFLDLMCELLLSSQSCVCLKNAFFVSECSDDMCLAKNGSNLNLRDNGVKGISHNLWSRFSHKIEWTKDCF